MGYSSVLFNMMRDVEWVSDHQSAATPHCQGPTVGYYRTYINFFVALSPNTNPLDSSEKVGDFYGQ